jgi:hypothetical protein
LGLGRLAGTGWFTDRHGEEQAGGSDDAAAVY